MLRGKRKKAVWIPKDPAKVTINDMELAAQMGYVPIIVGGKLIKFRRKRRNEN